MIKISTKGRYGTRLMLNLAQNYSNGNSPVILKNISDEEEISPRYLEQIIIPLKINKLVKSIRGAGGGYTLYKDPSQISIFDILEILEGPFCLVDCVDNEQSCHRSPFCPSHEIWKKATFMLKEYFQNVTLPDLIEIAERKKAV